VNVQDELLAMFPAGGWFVEAGAHDGVGDSQTLRLEQAGWQGLCVEPSSAFSGLVTSRRCKADHRCLAAHNGPVVFREMRGEAVELSGISGYFSDGWDRVSRPYDEKLIDGLTLTTMLATHEAPASIAFLCLDTEGSELGILASHDFSRFNFLTMAVEHNGVADRREDLMSLFAWTGHRLWHDDGTNLFLKHESVS
jgi:hypothetical protein